MNIIFFGSCEFSVPSLKSILAAGYKVSCVVTQPDRPKGRHLRIEGTAVKETATALGLKVYQPEKINTPEAVKFLKDLKPDLFVVIAYGQILSGQILDIPRIFALNSHASLLPSLRGAAPINWAIIKGARNTGVTIIKMTEQMDAGPIISSSEACVDSDDTAIELTVKLQDISARLIVDTLRQINGNNYKLVEQDGVVSYAPKLKKEDGLINWKLKTEDIYNLVRGCLPWPVAYTYYQGKILKVYKASIPPESQELSKPIQPGMIKEINPSAVRIACANGILEIRELQLEGTTKMSAAEFVRGHKIRAGEILGKI
jgi:methionyl-tRNA formyltransferase